MRIVLKLSLDESTQMPYWDAKVIEGQDTVLMQVVSKTFDPKQKGAYEQTYENCTVRVIKELSLAKDQNMIKHLLLNNG